MPQYPEYLTEMGHRPSMSFLAAKAKKAAHFGTHAITNSVFMRKCPLNFGFFPSVKRMELKVGLRK